MTTTPAWQPSARLRRRRRRSAVVRWTIRIVAVAAVFAVGVALGEVIAETPDPSKAPTTTSTRTLGPLPLTAPPQTTTVTITRP